MTYQPPKHRLEVLQKLALEALAPDDPRYVDTAQARGSQQTLGRLATKLGLSLKDGSFFPRQRGTSSFSVVPEAGST